MKLLLLSTLIAAAAVTAEQNASLRGRNLVKPSQANGPKEPKCVSVKSGTLVIPGGTQPIVGAGRNELGHNYQAHLFNGKLCDYYYLPGDACTEETTCRILGPSECATGVLGNDVDLVVKWNDAFLSNKDCDNDDEIDRPETIDALKGSGAWQTYHFSGKYLDEGKQCGWSLSYRIVAVPTSAVLVDGTWFTEGGEYEIGPPLGDSGIRNALAISQSRLNDHCGKSKLPESFKGDRPGLGGWADPLE